jgi:hypothetical protein
VIGAVRLLADGKAQWTTNDADSAKKLRENGTVKFPDCDRTFAACDLGGSALDKLG